MADRDDLIPANGWSTTVRKVLLTGEKKLKTRIAYNGDGMQEYIGEAAPDAAEGDLKWRIQKMTYSGTNLTSIDWADDTDAFTKSWTDRADYFA